MSSPRLRLGSLLIALALGGCSAGAPTTLPSAQPAETWPAATGPVASTAPDTSQGPSRRTLLVDTDVAADDIVALTFLVSSPQVEIAGITISGTGEADCTGGIDVVLRLLERLDAPDIPVACGRETPLAGTHAFPSAWRQSVDQGSGLDLPPTARRPSSSTAVELIVELAKQRPGLTILTLGPVTNLADAVLRDPGLAEGVGPVVFVMGGALHVPGNLVCCGAPVGNSVAEWNIYVDPHAARVLVDSGLTPSFVSLDGTNQVPLTIDFASRAMQPAESEAASVLAEILTANPFMTDGSFFLWDPLAAQLAAGYPIGSFSPERIVVEEAEGPESGFTRPTDGVPNIQYLQTVDPAAAQDTLLRILNGD